MKARVRRTEINAANSTTMAADTLPASATTTANTTASQCSTRQSAVGDEAAVAVPHLLLPNTCLPIAARTSIGIVPCTTPTTNDQPCTITA